MSNVLAGVPRRAACVAALFALAGGASARQSHPLEGQWTATILHPSQVTGIEASSAFGTFGGEQAGYIFGFFFGNVVDGFPPTGYDQRAVLWNGTAGSVVILSLAQSAAWDAHSGFQVGRTNGINESPLAAVWRGSQATYASLHPPGALSSNAFATFNGRHGGQVVLPTGTRAALWTGVSPAFIDLTPPGVAVASVRGMDGVNQVGVHQAVANGPRRAAVWSGTAASFVDLHPAGAVESTATATYGGTQVGWTRFGAMPWQTNAALWTGSAGSWVSLHPPGAVWSSATDTYEGFTVGSANSGAAIWVGTDPTPLSLSQYLPPGFSAFSATGVWADATTIYVTGGAQSVDERAVVWTRPRPQGGCYANCDGSTGNPKLTPADFVCFLNRYRAGDPYANCDGSTGNPALTPADFVCFLNRFRAGC